MKRLFIALLTLAVLSAALCLNASAVQTNQPAPTRVWGKVTPWDGEGLFLKNSNPDDPMNEVVVHVGDAPVVDAATGLPLDLAKVKEGDTLYAWIGPAATMSLPPHVFAEVVVGNLPADMAAPEYYVLHSAGWTDPAGGDEIVFSVQNETALDLAIFRDAEVTPWLTRQIIRLQDIQPGSQILVWQNGEGVVTKVLVFPYAYQGFASWSTTAMGVVNGETVQTPGKVLPGEGDEKTNLLPLRAMAEAAGYDVRWDKDLGAVVSLSGQTVFSVKPGSEILQTPEGEMSIAAPCLLEGGVTYLRAQDLCRALNLFFVSDFA